MTLSNAAHRLDQPDTLLQPSGQVTTWGDQAAAAYAPGASIHRHQDNQTPAFVALLTDGQPVSDQPQPPGGNAPARPRDVGTEANRLVGQLGSEDFRVREQASAGLFSLGTPGLPRLLELRDQARRPAGHRSNNPDLENVCNSIRNDLEVSSRLNRVFDRLTNGGPGGGFADVVRAAGDRDLPYAERNAAETVLRGMRADDILGNASFSSARDVTASARFTPMTDQQLKDLRGQLTQLSEQQLMDYVNRTTGWGRKQNIIGGAIAGAFGGGFDNGGTSEMDLRRALVASIMMEGRQGGSTAEQTASISAQLGERLYRNAAAGNDENSPLTRRDAAQAERYLRWAADHLPAERAIETNMQLADLYRRPTEQHRQGRPTECMQALQQANAEVARQAAGGDVPAQALELERITGNIQRAQLNLNEAQRTQLNRIVTDAAQQAQRYRQQQQEYEQQMQNLKRNAIPAGGGGGGGGGGNQGQANPNPGPAQPQPPQNPGG
jgi:hypothetical protein